MQVTSDPLWDEYREAMGGLAEVPTMLTHRLADAHSEREQAVLLARDQRDYELRRCLEWGTQAKRAVSNAEARLVASSVLIPDASHAPAINETDPELLAERVREVSREFESSLSALTVAHRRVRDTQSMAAVKARQRAFMLRRLAVAGVVGALVLLAFFWLV